MSTQVPTRFGDDELIRLDALVEAGVAPSRSETIRLAVVQLYEHHRRVAIGEAIAASYREVPQHASDDAWAMANAIALTEAEPW